MQRLRSKFLGFRHIFALYGQLKTPDIRSIFRSERDRPQAAWRGGSLGGAVGAMFSFEQTVLDLMANPIQ